ncbi:hypothetical protein [Kutzneria sp. NPDC051319]
MRTASGGHSRPKKSASNQRLMVLTAEPGSPSHDALRFLSSWQAHPAL